MAAAKVVEGFDPLEGLLTGLVVVGEVVAIGVFEFEGGEERFSSCVVVAIAPAAHGGSDTAGRELAAKTLAGILHAAIGMEEQASGAASAPALDVPRPVVPSWPPVPRPVSLVVLFSPCRLFSSLAIFFLCFFLIPRKLHLRYLILNLGCFLLRLQLILSVLFC